MIGIVMFFVALFALLLGFPVAFTFGGIALIFGVWAEGMDMFALCLIAFNPLWRTRC
ncbi:TRAP dicarboxylate transporter DctM subunitunknown substrate 6 [Vibrio maritimus]|uniref:TRAP C4-dicarboxylate transport system permease DctM subunit domain-containing protein n=1 Tax=Vibrio maritimus TaxID=990268 RepID=A0A090SSG6_9VIBR|nr:TRAP dicarboxylate transporter DctM subunitunknown substrate 6 [Vibrio maritimus]